MDFGERKRGAKEVTKQREANSRSLKVAAFVSHSFSYGCVINTSVNLVSCPDARDVFWKAGHTLTPLEKEINN